MAVDKSFVVKNGLEVNSNLIIADATNKKVGIASTAPRFTLDVRGGIAATDITIEDTATIATLNVSTTGDVNLGNLNVTGFSTLGGLSVDQLKVTGFTTFSDISYDEISGRNLTLTGIATIPTFVGLTSFNDGITVAGVSTISTLNVSGVVTATHAKVSGGATIATATVTTATVTTANITTGNVTTLAGYPNFSGGITVAGVSTFSGQINAGTAATIATNGNATFSGIVTATQFQGGGIGVGVGTTGGVVGYGATFFEFKGPGFTTAQYNAAVGIVTVNFQGGGGSASIGVGSTPGDAFTGIITAGNLWYNSGLGRLFIYYQDDNSAQWVDAAPFNVGIITQLTSVAFSTGTVAAPSLSFGVDTNTGFFAPADGSVSYSSNGAGIVTFNSTGVVATSYFGDGSNLTGIDATSIKDSGGNVKVQGNPNGVVVTGILTGSNAKFTGIVTATSFVGSGEGLTGVASTDNIQTATEAEFLGGVKISGVTTTSGLVDMNAGGTATSFKIEDLTSGRVVLAGTGGEVEDSGNLTFNGSTLAVTGSQTVSSNLTVSGNVSIDGTLSYLDVTNIDSVGIITAQEGIQVLANGLTITGVSTFNDNIDLQDNDKILLGTGDDLQIYHDGSASYIAADDLRVTNAAVNETLAKFVNGGAVELYYNDTKRLETTNGGVIVTGVCTATDFDSTSDARLKTNVQVVDGALSKVNNLRGVSFNWIESGQPSYGVIAQELETVLPELVHGGDPKRVNYNGIIGVLIESIKELSARVDELENK